MDNKNIIGFVIVIGATLILQGCPQAVRDYRDVDFGVGCVINGVDAKLGYMNQQGTMELAKLKCSDDLPENFCFEVDNQRTGVQARVGAGCTDD